MLNLKKLLIKILQNMTTETETCDIASGWESYTTGQDPYVMKQGKVVHFNWACKPTATITLNANPVQCCTIPEGFRPKRTVYELAQGSGTSMFLITIYPGGGVMIARLRDIGNANGVYTQGTTGHWFPLNLTWVVD